MISRPPIGSDGEPQTTGGTIELEQGNSAIPPLDGGDLHPDRRRHLRDARCRAATRPMDLLSPAAALVPADVHRPLHVLPALFCPQPEAGSMTASEEIDAK